MRFLAILVLVLATVSALPAGSGKGDKDRKTEAYALISGSVFRHSGLTLPGAEVILAPAAETGKRGRVKKLVATTDARGEFAFRVPAGQAEYTLSVRAKGYQEQHKPVATTGEDRIDVFVRLENASK